MAKYCTGEISAFTARDLGVGHAIATTAGKEQKQGNTVTQLPRCGEMNVTGKQESRCLKKQLRC